jgi:UDP-glucose 4-epimerase
MRILITGGGGFIGRHLAADLVHRSHSVLVLDNLYRGTFESLKGLDLEYVRGDVRDIDKLRCLMTRVDLVYHLAAQSNVIGSMQDIEYSFSTNVVGTFNVLRSAAEAGIRRVVFTSSREIYGDVDCLPVLETTPYNPKNSYGASKVAGELYCRMFSSKVEVVVLRLANVYGPGDRDRVVPIFLSNALRGDPLVIFGTGKLLDFISLYEVIYCLLKAGERDVAGAVINVGSGFGIALPDLAKRILQITESVSPIKFESPRRIEIDRFVADIGRARELLDFMPAEPLAFLAQTCAFGQSERY